LEEFHKNGRPVWRKRNAEHRPIQHKKYVALLIKRLEELEENTRPSAGAKTERGKDRAAFVALQTAGQLVDALAGWALNHQIGLALANLEFLPLGASSLRTHPEYVATRVQVDSHRHEREGGAVFSGIKPERLGTAEKRRALRNLCHANSGGFERLLAHELHEGLEALEWGRSTPLLQPVKSRLHGGLPEMECQLGALAFVHYYRGRRERKALESAAAEFGVSKETIRSWEKRLPKELGALQVARHLKFAYNAGTHARENPEYQRLGNYGLEALQWWARKYKMLKRRRKGRVR
jgi:hypothetical protein